MVISKHFWLNLENNEEIFGEFRKFFLEIVKILRKYIRCPGKFRKMKKKITRSLEENFEKTKSKFWRNFLDKKCIKFKLIRNAPFAPNRASLSHQPIASYWSLVYIRATARAICEETNFVDASSGCLPITHGNGSHQQRCVISFSYIFYIFQHWNLIEKGFFSRRFHRSGHLQQIFFQISFSTNYAQIFQKAARNRDGTPGFCQMNLCWPSAPVSHTLPGVLLQNIFFPPILPSS